jgi:hypothetical protein
MSWITGLPSVSPELKLQWHQIETLIYELTIYIVKVLSDFQILLSQRIYENLPFLVTSTFNINLLMIFHFHSVQKDRIGIVTEV